MARRAVIIIDAQAQDARASIENLSEEFRSMEASVEIAEQSMRDMGVASERSSQDIRGMDAAVTQFSDQARRMETATERASQGVREYGQATERASQQTLTMRSSVGASANNLGFEMVQATQDAKFGMAGVANQIPLMTEQFTQLTAKTGSTTAALKALGSSVLGPVGIVGAITLLLTFQDDITSFFTESGESAEDATESFQGFFRETEQGLSSLDQLQKELENVGGSVGIFSTLWVDVRRSAANWRDILIGQTDRSILGGLGALAEHLNKVSKNLSIGRRVLGNFFETLAVRWEESQLVRRVERLREELSKTTPAALIAQDRLRNLGVDVDKIVSGSFEEARAEVIRFREELQALTFGGLLEEDPATAAQQARREFQQVSKEALRMSAVPGVSEEDIIQQRVDFLERTLEQAAAALSPEEFQQNFGDLAQRLSVLQGELENMGDSGEDAADKTTTALEEQESAIGEQESAIEDLRDTLKTLRSPEGNRLALLKDQKQELERQAELARFLNRLEEGLVFPEMQERIQRARRFTGGQVSGAPPTSPGAGQVLADPGQDLAASLRQNIQRGELAGSARELGIVLRDEAEKGTEEGTEEGISLGAEAGAAAFQGLMSTAVSEITRQIEGDWPRAITSAVLQALSSAAVQRLRKLLEGGGGNGGDKVSQALSLANTLLQSQLGGQQRGTPPIAGLNFLPGGGGGSFKFNSAQGALGIATIGQLLGRGIRPEKNKGAGLAGFGGAGIGAILGSVIPGFGTLLGAGIGGGLGGLLGGVFEHGGTMPRSGLALVGEAGPELVALRGGSRVESTGDTRRLVQEAASTRQDGTNAIVQKLDEVASRVEGLEVKISAFEAGAEIGRAQGRLERAGDRIYPAKA